MQDTRGNSQDVPDSRVGHGYFSEWVLLSVSFEEKPIDFKASVLLRLLSVGGVTRVY